MNILNKNSKTTIAVMITLLTIPVRGASVQAMAERNDTKLKSVAAFASEGLGRLYDLFKKAASVDSATKSHSDSIHEAVNITKDYTTGILFEVPIQTVIDLRMRLGGVRPIPRTFKAVGIWETAGINIYIDPFAVMHKSQDLIVIPVQLDSGGKCMIRVDHRTGDVVSVNYYESGFHCPFRCPSDERLELTEKVPHAIRHSYGNTIDLGLGELTVSVSLSPDKKKVIGTITSSKEDETIASIRQ